MLPQQGPSKLGEFTAFPSLKRGYVAESAMYMYGILLPCIQRYSLGMYCPETVAPGGDDRCLVFAAWEPTCFGQVLMCGNTFE